MAKLVLLHKPGSIHDDDPDTRYDFPRQYLKAASDGIGDWAVYCGPAKAAPRGYFAVAKIAAVIEKPRAQGRYLAVIEPASYLDFARTVPRLIDARPLESLLTAADGSPKRGGAQQLAIRRLPEAELARIVDLGLPHNLGAIETGKDDAAPPGFAGDRPVRERPVIERLVSRPYRALAFRRRVREAHDHRWAMSGLCPRNCLGRPEVEAAHIRPVEHQGSDFVRNGLALSATLHRMFDRGLVSVAEDGETILVSQNKVPGEVRHPLLSPSGRLTAPRDPRDALHPENLRWHRERVFGQVATEGPLPWG